MQWLLRRPLLPSCPWQSHQPQGWSRHNPKQWTGCLWPCWQNPKQRHEPPKPRFARPLHKGHSHHWMSRSPRMNCPMQKPNHPRQSHPCWWLEPHCLVLSNSCLTLSIVDPWQLLYCPLKCWPHRSRLQRSHWLYFVHRWPYQKHLLHCCPHPKYSSQMYLGY